MIVAKSASKELRRFPKKDAEKIFKVLVALPSNPYAGDMEKMEGEDGVWRRRVGQYRILYHLDTAEKLIFVFRIERRTSTTY